MTRRGWLLALVAVALVAAAPRVGRADPTPPTAPAVGAPTGNAIALLPLDAEHNLEIYGQPVASELARALIAGGLQVVVVGPRMAVPAGVQLVIDGTISAGKAGAIKLGIRIRSPSDGKVETTSATAAELARLDAAAAELSAKVLPLARDRLAALRAARDDRDHDAGHGHVTQTTALPSAERLVLVAVSDETHKPNNAALVAALAPAVADWTRTHHRHQQAIDPSKLVPQLASKALAGADDLAIGLWVVSYAPEAGGVPLARARVRVRVADRTAIVFDRVIVTDTVVGDRGLRAGELAARVSREVLAILRPHMLRHVPAWE